MENSKGSSNIRNFMYSGKHTLLPPKSPFPSVSPASVDYVPGSAIGLKAVHNPREGNTHHQRTSSESFLVEEQPSWLDDLLNEPDTPVRRGGHRRSSSDSFAYLDVANSPNIDYAAQHEYIYKNMISIPSWGSKDFNYNKDPQLTSLYSEMNVSKQKNKACDTSLNAAINSTGLPSARENTVLQSLGLLYAPLEADAFLYSTNEKQDEIESTPHDSKTSSERKDGLHAKSSSSDNDTKRAKQQFAQRSRVRKLQYIAELERNVQGLQAEGSEISAELEFLNQQNLILGMENKSLKQRLESLAQEHFIKCLEHKVLEREIDRLHALYQQQQQQNLQPHQQQQQPHNQHKQKPSSSHRRTNSRDLDSQFANLYLKKKDDNSARDTVTGPLHI